MLESARRRRIHSRDRRRDGPDGRDRLNDGSPLPVAVIVPAFNAAATLGATLRSVLAQTRPPAEILVVDDGSTDGTAAVARAAGVRVLVQRNAGPGAARNAGVAATVAPWLAFLDADDAWYPNRLARQWALHERAGDVALIGSNYLRVFEQSGRSEACFETSAVYDRVPKEWLGPDMVRVAAPAFAYWIAREQFVAPSTILVRRDVLERYPFMQDDETTPLAHMSEDIEWYLRVARDFGIGLVESPLIRYSVRLDSLSANYGRSHYGILKLGDRIAAATDRYAPGAHASFQMLRPHHQRLAAKAYLVAGDPAAAATVLHEPLSGPASRATLGMRALVALASWPPGLTALRSALALRRRLRAATGGSG